MRWFNKPLEKIQERYKSIEGIKVYFNNDLPFMPKPEEVFFVEDHYHKELNDFIQQYKGEITSLLFHGRNGFDSSIFYYFPLRLEEDANLYNKILNYRYPSLSSTGFKMKKDAGIQKVYDDFLSYADDESRGILACGFLRYWGYDNDKQKFLFAYYPLTNTDNYDDLEEQCVAFVKRFNYEPVTLLPQPEYVHPNDDIYEFRYKGLQCSLDIPEDFYTNSENADNWFKIEDWEIAKEIKERIELLKERGFSNMVIKSLFEFEPEQKLSRLLITKDYRIFLPDYNNLEIIMHPLPKTVFFFFLKHPEGILFKHLIDHKNELMTIYQTISGKTNLDEMHRSINKIVDSTDNGVNEKCSRIREAFIREFDEELAKFYFVTGHRATVKRIALDRSLLIMEADI